MPDSSDDSNANELVDLEMLSDYFEQLGAQNPYYSWLGLELETLERGRAVIRLPFDDRYTTPSPPAPSTVHGGIVATLIDVATIGALLTTVEEPVGVTTTDMAVSFLQSATDDLYATAEVRKSGSTLGVADVRVETPADDENPDPIATGHVTCRFFD